MTENKPSMYVFAGNNGSGKSTLRSLIADKMGISINIDPDAIARRLDPIHPELQRISAGKEVIRTVKQYLKEGKDFSIETTLAGQNAIKQIKKAKELGYEINLIYVALNNVHQNIERVGMRVKNGGHDIPTKDIIRRNITSFENLYKNMHLVDHIMLIDNTVDGGRIVLEVNNSVINYKSQNFPKWGIPVWEKYR